MSGENPIAALFSVVTIFGYAVVQLATEPLNPGHPSFAMILAFLGASVGAVWELVATASRPGVEDRAARVRDRAFWFSLAAGWVGILVYLGCLIATLL